MTQAVVGLPDALTALAAGTLSFVSPCVLPLIPAYLSFISGESAADIRNGTANRPRVFFRTLFFVTGFSLVFVALAVIFGGGMRFIGSSARTVVGRVAGAIVLLLGLNILFDRIPLLRGDYRAHPKAGREALNGGKEPGRTATALKPLLLGMAFAAGWSPCVGPILASILLYAGQAGGVAQSVWLLLAYSLGLGIPFLLAGIFLDRAAPVMEWLKRHMQAVRIASGLLLAGFGLAMLSGTLSALTTLLSRLFLR